MRKQEHTRRSNLILGVGIFGVFLLLAIVGPVFFSQPEHLGPQITVCCVAFALFFSFAGLQLGAKFNISGWLTLAVFAVGYLTLLVWDTGDFRPDAHWFVMSPLGYVGGALALGSTDDPQKQAAGRTKNDGPVLQCYSSKHQIDPPSESLSELIQSLNGTTLSLIRLVWGSRCLEIAGGLDGRYVLYWTQNYHDDAAWCVYQRAARKELAGRAGQTMFIGNIQGYIPAEHWCTEHEAQRMAASFQVDGFVDHEGGHEWVNSGLMAGGARPSLPMQSSGDISS